MSFKFEKLLIWQKAMDLGEHVHKISRQFPKEEMYNLTSQTIRSADSIALKIAEGSISQSNPEQHRFLGYSVRSIAELITCLYKAKRREYINESDFKWIYQECFDLMNMTIGFKNKMK